MLLANMRVAKKIKESFPELALLRNHKPPKENMVVKLKERLQKLGKGTRHEKIIVQNSKLFQLFRHCHRLRKLKDTGYISTSHKRQTGQEAE